MKIVTWNCAQKFREKHLLVFGLEADLYVIQECEDPGVLPEKYPPFFYRDYEYLWTGDNHSKGLGVFARKGNSLELVRHAPTGLKYHLSCVWNKETKILAVWNHHNNEGRKRYIGQLWQYIQMFRAELSETFIVGDFNSNAIWDKEHRGCSHSDVVRELRELGIVSYYHARTREEHGQESKATFYLHKNVEQPYHIDYLFGPERCVTKLRSLDVLDFQDWRASSDHVPIVIQVGP